MSLTKFVNVFTEDDFLEPDANGISRIKDPTMVYDKLRELTDGSGGYHWQVKHVGERKNGRAYLVGELQVSVESDTYTVPGVAEAPDNIPNMGMAGLATMALANACLRGLGMAESIYNNDKVTPAPPAPHNGNTPSEAAFERTAAQFNGPPQQPRQQPTYQPRSAPAMYTRPQGGGNYGGGGNRNYGPWDGTAIIKTGKNAGKAWNQLPIGTLEFLANMPQPSESAVKEINRRMASQLPEVNLNDGYDQE